MSALAVIRPDGWDLALFVHVLGALALVGSLALAASYLFAARRDGSLEMLRTGYRSLLLAALPAYIVMRAGSEWILSKEQLGDAKLSWLDIGYSTADGGLLLIIVATVAAGLSVRRARQSGSGGAGTTVAAVLVAIAIVAYVVAIWAMTTKPT